MEGKKSNWWWPDVGSVEAAKKTSMYGFWAAVFSAVVTALFASWALGSGERALGIIDAWAFVDAVIFSAVAVGIYKESRFAAVAGLVIFLIEKIDQFATTGKPTGVFMGIILTLCYVGAIRGTYALWRLRTPQAG